MIPCLTPHNSSTPYFPSTNHLTTLLPPTQTPPSISNLFPLNYSNSLLRTDHESRPIWICPNLHLYLETYSPIYQQAYDFLIAISDPVSRPLFIHEYVITRYSLYAAASLGLSPHDILFGLQRLCKNQVPQEVRGFITKNTEKCGKVKLVLKNQRYYIESSYSSVLHELIASSEVIKFARCDYNIRTPEGRQQHEKYQLQLQREQEMRLLEERERNANFNPFFKKKVGQGFFNRQNKPNIDNGDDNNNNNDDNDDNMNNDNDKDDKKKKKKSEKDKKNNEEIKNQPNQTNFGPFGGAGGGTNLNGLGDKRSALVQEAILDYTYDLETGFILEKLNFGDDGNPSKNGPNGKNTKLGQQRNLAGGLMLQGTGVLDKDGKRQLQQVNQRAAMGLVDDLGLIEDEFDFMDFEHLDDFGNSTKNLQKNNQNNGEKFGKFHTFEAFKSTMNSYYDDSDDDTNGNRELLDELSRNDDDFSSFSSQRNKKTGKKFNSKQNSEKILQDEKKTKKIKREDDEDTSDYEDLDGFIDDSDDDMDDNPHKTALKAQKLKKKSENIQKTNKSSKKMSNNSDSDDTDDDSDDFNTDDSDDDDDNNDEIDENERDFLQEVFSGEIRADEKDYLIFKNGKKIIKPNLSKRKHDEWSKILIKKRSIFQERQQFLKGQKKIKTLQKFLQPQFLYSFEIQPNKVEAVRKASNEVGYPMLEEYDFRNDASMDQHILNMSLRPQAQIREYQEKALSKMFGSGRARSGIIVLPCGAGKTLVGITAMSTLNRSCLIVVSTGVAAAQWREQIKLWTTLPEEYIYLFTKGSKIEFKTKPKVIIATYSMLAFSGTRGTEAQKAIDVIKGSEWGLVLLDEVHVAPADGFKKSITLTHSRCKLGLTATLVREDDKVTSLIEMIGPKLYEASWLDLSRQGFIATVRCYEVWCPMDPDFFQVWLASNSHHLQKLLYVTNPNKYQALEMLVMLHISRGDKVMIFCEDTIAIKLFSKTLGFPYILGETKGNDRLTLLSNFSSSPHGDALFISKIGDNSIDLPDTNVIIQISSHYASRRQEAQRLGRILRQKSTKSGSSVDAHFYTLVSQDTDEMRYATKRQRFLVDQGYAYKVLKQADIKEQLSKLDLFKYAKKPLAFQTQQERVQLLNTVREVFWNRQGIDDTNFKEFGTSARSANQQQRQHNRNNNHYSDDSESDSDFKPKSKKKQRTGI